MSPLTPIAGLLVAALAIYVALTLTVRTLRTARLPIVEAPGGAQARLARLARPVAEAIWCVQDRNERDWTWPQYTVVLLLLALICVIVLALLTLVVYGATLL